MTPTPMFHSDYAQMDHEDWYQEARTAVMAHQDAAWKADEKAAAEAAAPLLEELKDELTAIKHAFDKVLG